MSSLTLRESLRLKPYLPDRPPPGSDFHRLHFIQAWCDAVGRMTTMQLQDRGKALLEIWQVHAQCTSGASSRDTSVGDIPTSQYPELLRSLAQEHRRSRRAKATPLDRRIAWLSSALDLDDVEHAIVLVLARYAAEDAWRKLFAALPGGGICPSSGCIALLTGLNTSRIEDRFGTGAKLWRTGLVNNDGDGEFSPGDILRRIARSGSAPSRLAKQLVPIAPRSTLGWDDFAHIGPIRDIAVKLLAHDRPAPILLYGSPGTGKSEFARLIAEQAGKRAVFAGLENISGGEPSRRDRLGHLTLLRALTRGQQDRVLVMDEADDVLQLGLLDDRGMRSKMFLNRLVEEGDRPTIWIVNEPRMFEQSLIRRMAIAIEFPNPPLHVRRRIVTRQAKAAKLKLSSDAVSRLASLKASPAVSAAAVRGAKSTGGGAAEAMTIAEGLVTVMRGRPSAAEPLPSGYDPQFALANTDLATLAHRLSNAPQRRWSLLLSGPSGTGKSAYACHLAERLGLELILKRGSDLLGMFVGETEARIAKAFREAARGGALLLIDEADDFLFDRRSATRSWETSMVNEMLRQMEALQTPFVATTNLDDRLDPAAQRRFTMRVKFQALDEERARSLFRSRYGADLPRHVDLAGVTPGDFAVVSRRAELLGESRADMLARWLIDEREARDQTPVRIGF